jgi:hypothetical protein
LADFSDKLLKALGRKGFKREDYRRAWGQELGELGRAASLYCGDPIVKDALWMAKDCMRAMLEDSSGSGTEDLDENDSGNAPATLAAAPVERAAASSRSPAEVGSAGARAAARQTPRHAFPHAVAKSTAARQFGGSAKGSNPAASQPAAAAIGRARACQDRPQKGGLDQALIGRLGASGLCRQLDAFVSKLVGASRRRDPGGEDCQLWVSELAELARAARLFPGYADVESKLLAAVDCWKAFTVDDSDSDSDGEDSQDETEFRAESVDGWQQPVAWALGNRGGWGEGFAGAPLSPCESRADHHDDPRRGWCDDDEPD